MTDENPNEQSNEETPNRLPNPPQTKKTLGGMRSS